MTSVTGPQSELLAKFVWARDEKVWVAYCTNKETNKHYRLVWQETHPENLGWAECKCRGCVRMDIVKNGNDTIENVVAMINEAE